MYSRINIAFNPTECSACVKALEFLKFSNDTNIFFVLQSKYKSDSSVLVKNNFLEQYNAKYIWSDSDYDSLTKFGVASTFQYVCDDSIHSFILPLKKINKNIVDITNSLNLKIDTIIIDIPHINSAAIYPSNSFIYFVDLIRNEVQAYNFVENKLNYKITLNDSIVKSSYNIALGIDGYKKNYDTLKSWKVPNVYQIINISQPNDTLYIVVKYKFIYDSANASVASMYVLNKYYDGNLISIDRLPLDYKFGNDTFFISQNFQVINGNFYGNILKFTNFETNRYFLAKFSHTNNKYNVDSVLTGYTLPMVYKNMNYASPLFYGHFFVLPLECKIYDLNSNDLINVKEFDNGEKEINVFTQPKMYVVDFKVGNNYCWVLYKDTERNKRYFLKYDKLNKKIIFEKEVMYDDNLGILINDFNFNSLMIKTNENKVIIENYSM